MIINLYLYFLCWFVGFLFDLLKKISKQLLCAQSDRQRYQDQVLVLTNLCQEEKQKSEKIQLELNKLKASVTTNKRKPTKGAKKGSVLDTSVDFYMNQVGIWQEKFATEASRAEALDKQIQQEKTDNSVKIESLELHLKQAKLEATNLKDQLHKLQYPPRASPSPATTPPYSPIAPPRIIPPKSVTPPISPVKPITKTPLISPVQKPTIPQLPPPRAGSVLRLPPAGTFKATAYKSAAPKPTTSPTHEVINLIWDNWEDEIDNYIVSEKEKDKDEDFLPNVHKKKKKSFILD